MAGAAEATKIGVNQLAEAEQEDAMPLDPVDQARVDLLREKREALTAAGFSEADAVAIILSEIEFGPLDVRTPQLGGGQPTGGAAPAPAGPDTSLLAGSWGLTPVLSVDCGGPDDLGFRLSSTAVTIAFINEDEGRIRLTFGPDRYATGTVTDVGAGAFECLAVFARSKVRLRFSGDWVNASSEEISARFRFEFDGSNLDVGIFGLPMGMFPNPCRDIDLPLTMTRQ